MQREEQMEEEREEELRHKQVKEKPKLRIKDPSPELPKPETPSLEHPKRESPSAAKEEHPFPSVPPTSREVDYKTFLNKTMGLPWPQIPTFVLISLSKAMDFA